VGKSGVLTSKRYFIRGRVQGVGFRYFVQQVANDLGIEGYTRNLDDGRVEVYATGTTEQLNELSGSLWRGPRMSDVHGVDEQEASLEKMTGFRIER
jgi:acylphosphatase